MFDYYVVDIRQTHTNILMYPVSLKYLGRESETFAKIMYAPYPISICKH